MRNVFCGTRTRVLAAALISIVIVAPPLPRAAAHAATLAGFHLSAAQEHIQSSGRIQLVRDDAARLGRIAICKGAARNRYRNWVRACNGNHPAGSQALEDCLDQALTSFSIEMSSCNRIR